MTACGRCGRESRPWPIRRPPVCSPKEWAYCIRPQPFDLGARPDDDMTCASCGGHFQRWEGVDDPEPTCPWCLVESRFDA